MFDELEESFNQIALGVEGEIAIALDFAIRFGRDNRLDRADLEARNVFVGVVALVSEKGLGLYFRGQRFGLSDVVDLAARQTERDGFPKASTTIWIFVVRPPRDRPMA